MKIPDDLVKKHKDAKESIDLWVKENVPLGTEVVHKNGYYKGRRAKVRQVVWFGDDDGSIQYVVNVVVSTYALRGKDEFVNHYQHHQNTYASFDEYYSKVPEA